jgi:hypothetical protein
VVGHLGIGALAHWRIGGIGALAHWRIGALGHWRIGALGHWPWGQLGQLVHLGHCGIRVLGSHGTEAALLYTRHALTLAVNLERAPAVSPYSHIYVPGACHNNNNNNWQRAAHRPRQAG